MDKPLRFAVVGSGAMSGTYIRALSRLEEAECVALVSRQGKRPDALVGREDVEIAESLANVGVEFDAAILATPNGCHHVGACEAARLGKHVLTEKVLDVTREAMDAIITACRNGGVKLGVAFQRRMSPDNIVVKELLAGGSLGRVFGTDLSVKFYRDQAYYDSAAYRGTRDVDGGGPFMQQAAHNVDIYGWFFGMPTHVTSMLGTFCHEMAGEDHGVALLRHQDGMIGTITASTCARPGFPARLEIFAEKGSVIMENDAITEWHIAGAENPSRAGDFEVHSGAGSATVEETAGHEAIIRDFVQAVREDREPVVNGESGRLTTELILRIYENSV